MALVKYGSLVTELKGKVGGQVFQGGQYGHIMRNSYKGTNKRNFIASVPNLLLNGLSVQWNSLSNLQRIAWNDNAWMFPVNDKFGNPMVLNGYDCFVHLNFVILQAAETVLLTAPTENSGPTIYTVTGSIHYDTTTFELEYSPTPVGSGELLVFDLFPPCKQPTVENRSKRRRLRIFRKDGEDTPDDVYEPYDEQMHGPLQSANDGNYVPIEYFSVNLSNGVQSVKQICFALIEN